MPAPDRSSSTRINTFTDATSGQRLTAVVVALLGGTLAGMLCAWLAVSVLDGVSWLVQTLAFGVIGLVVGLGLLGLMGRLRRRR